MQKVLTETFFARPATIVAEELLGKYIVTIINNKPTGFMIIETEAYEGFDDQASHAARGLTPRTKVMFGRAGRFYVYLIYGLHQMLNVVTHSEGVPSAVLIRGIKGICGPGRVTKFLSITKAHNALAASKETGVWFEDRGVKVLIQEIVTTPRIGVEYAGPVWSQKLWRYVYAFKSNKR